jgi:hypothetical protein
MYDMIRKLHLDGQDLPYQHHRPSAWSDDDIQDGRQRRRSSLTDYELNIFQDTTRLPKSQTLVTHRLSIPKTDQGLLRKNSNPLRRRSTIHRLNSTTNNDSNTVPVQSNEYTSITDG